MSTEQAGWLLRSVDLAEELSRLEREHRARLAALLLSFVEVMDSFDRVLAACQGSGTQPATVPASTLRLMARQLEAALGKAGVTALACLGQPAEPGRHEVAGVRAVAGAPEDQVVEEILRGYEWEGELLRKPRVIVAEAGAPRDKE